MRKDSGEDLGLTLLPGANRAVLCIWDTQIVRSAREARFLASAGCDSDAAQPSRSMSSFLDTYRSCFETLLGPAPLERGRIIIEANADGAGEHVHAVRELARELGLSCHDGSTCVYLTLDPMNLLPLASMLRLVVAGDVAQVTLSDGCWTLHLCLTDGSLQVRATGLDPHMKRALRLLGFSGSGLPREVARLMEPLPFPASRLLQRVILQALGEQDFGFEAVLTSSSPLASTAAIPRGRTRAPKTAHVATDPGDPSSA